MVAMAFGLTGCRASTPSQELRTAAALAEQVSVQGYRRLGEVERGPGVKIWLVGPSNVDLFAAVTAPGWNAAPPPAWYRTDTDVLYEPVIHSSTETIEEGGLDCRIVVKRLRPGEQPPYTVRLSQDDIGAIATGQLWYLELYVSCLP